MKPLIFFAGLFLSLSMNVAHATGCNTQLDCNTFPGSCSSGICQNECHFDSDCGSGQRCDTDNGNTCVSASPGWSECHSNLDCSFGLTCDSGGMCRGNN